MYNGRTDCWNYEEEEESRFNDMLYENAVDVNKNEVDDELYEIECNYIEEDPDTNECFLLDQVEQQRNIIM